MGLESPTLQERRDRSALVILVPEVAGLIGAVRAQWTEDGASVPPHVTLFHPFHAPVETTQEVRTRVSTIASAVPAFRFTLDRIERFGNRILYLAPEPAAPFADLVDRLRAGFPDVSPYWDRVSAVVPHVTIADAGEADDASGFDALSESIGPMLPVACEAREVVLIQRVRPAPAPWDVTGRFPLRA